MLNEWLFLSLIGYFTVLDDYGVSRVEYILLYYECLFGIDGAVRENEFGANVPVRPGQMLRM